MDPLLTFVDLKVIFNNPNTIGNFFKFKDSIPELMRASVVYLFTCPKCNFGTYVGCTDRLLKVRIDSHIGVSFRTQQPLNSKENSSIRNHTIKCKHHIQYKDFKILAQIKEKRSLHIVESLLIKETNPTLNHDSSSVPLYIAWLIIYAFFQVRLYISWKYITVCQCQNVGWPLGWTCMYIYAIVPIFKHKCAPIIHINISAIFHMGLSIYNYVFDCLFLLYVFYVFYFFWEFMSLFAVFMRVNIFSVELYVMDIYGSWGFTCTLLFVLLV